MNKEDRLKKIEADYIEKRDEKALSMLNRSSIIFKFRYKRSAFRASRHNGQH